MRRDRMLLWLVVLTAMAAAGAIAAELSQSQRVRLETADDGSRSVDEAAFYALLENARDDPPTKTGAVFPDFAAMRADPAKHRGQLSYIEGRLIVGYGGYKPLPLSREGFASVRGLVLQIGRFGQPGEAITADDMVVVFLTDPPALSRPTLETAPGLVAESGRTVRVPVRFYKVLADEPRAGEGERMYLAFVGASAEIEPTGAGGLSDPSVRRTILFAAAVGAMLVYWFWRIARVRRRRSLRPSKVDEYRELRRQRREAREAQVDAAGPAAAVPLPEDPIEAMSMLYNDRPDATSALQHMSFDNGDSGGDDADPERHPGGPHPDPPHEKPSRDA